MKSPQFDIFDSLKYNGNVTVNYWFTYNRIFQGKLQCKLAFTHY